MGLFLAAALGGIEGATRRFSELNELQIKEEASLLERMQKTNAGVKTSFKNALFAQRFDDAHNMGYGATYEDPASFQKAYLMNEGLLGENATAFNQVDAGEDSVINVAKLANLKAPDGTTRLMTWLNRPENRSKYSETQTRLNAAFISEITKLREATMTKDGGEFVTKQVEDVRQQLPLDDLTPEDVDILDTLHARAYLMNDRDFIEQFGSGHANFSVTRDSSNQATVNIEDYTYRPIVDPNDQKDVKTLTPEDHAPETISVFTKASRGSIRTMGNLSKTTHRLVDVYPKVSEQEVSYFVGNITYGFNSGELKFSESGMIRTTPSALMRYRPSLSQMIKDTSLGDTVSLLALSMPDYKDPTADKTFGSSAAAKQRAQFTDRIRKQNFGLDEDTKAKWDAENRNLQSLIDTGDNLTTLLTVVGADVGVGAEIPALVAAARSGISTLAEYFNVSDNIINNLKGQVDQIASPGFEKLSADRKQLIFNALTKELSTQFTSSYAKILDSSLSGASRLAEGDVQRAERGLQLTRLLANPATAPYVVQSLVQRSRYQLQMNKLILEGNASEVAAAAFIMNHAQPAQLMFNHSLEEILNDVNSRTGKEYTLEQLQTPPEEKEAKPSTGGTVVDSNDARFQDPIGSVAPPPVEEEEQGTD